MANRKRGVFSLPEELVTNEKLSTKKEMALRKSARCPPVPIKIRKNLNKNVSIKPRPIFFNKPVSLSTLYDPNLSAPYLDQVYIYYGKLGEGSFGYVHKVRSREDNKMYAIKRLKSCISVKDRYAEIHNNEKIGVHENCVQFFIAWEENADVYIALEYCDMSLADYASCNNDIPEELLWNVLYDICKAFVYLHGRNLLHLDVKPGNIMMINGYFKLGDFGLLADLTSGTSIFKSTLSDGDSKYLALEVLEGIYTPACDIFGLGISLLELAADLELPDHGPLWQQLRRYILPQSFYNRVSLGLQVLVERMLSPQYEVRPAANKILKFKSLRDIERKDAKYSRTDFASPLRNNNEKPFDVLPIFSSTPLVGSNQLSERNDENDLDICVSRKSLQFNMADSPQRINTKVLSPRNRSLSFAELSDDSGLDKIDSFSDFDQTINSEMDIENNSSCLNNNKLIMSPSSPFHDSGIMSTPILRMTNVKARLTKTKLSFN